MKTYIGMRDPHTRVFEVRVKDGSSDEELDLRLDLSDGSPGGFGWGYVGSGPSQLAVAIAADVLGDDRRAYSLMGKLTRGWVSKLPEDSWQITAPELLAIIETL